MTIKELIIEKISQLAPEQQQQVWEFINTLPQPSKNTEISPLGKKLRELRAQIVASGEPLLSREDLDRELTERRGSTDWDRIDAMSDEDIDTSDIPPLTDEFFAKAKLRMPSSSLATVAIRVDAETLAWFQSKGEEAEQS
jgi:uncharacterized protein (DUF4415 family)